MVPNCGDEYLRKRHLGYINDDLLQPEPKDPNFKR
jgi:hypothetical protein